MKKTIAAIIVTLGFTNAQISSAEWYDGGTLIQAGALEWQEATPQNKVASSSDIIAKLYQDNMLKSDIQKSIRTVDDFKPLASQLALCIEKATEKDPDPETNKRMYVNQKVVSMATMCIISMGWLK